MDKLQKLKNILKGMDSVFIAFSGGVDSSFLAAVAHKTHGENAMAVTVSTPFFPHAVIERASLLAKTIGIAHCVLYQKLPLLCWKNSVDRCYLCKRAMFSRISSEAKKEVFAP